MKNIYFLSLITILIIGLLISGCASQVPTATSAPAVVPSSTQPISSSQPPTSKPSSVLPNTPTPEPITLRFDNTIYLPYGIGSITNKWFTDQLEQRTNGRYKFMHLYAGSLSKAGEELVAVQTGISDISMISIVYYPTQMYLTAGFTRCVPFTLDDLPKITDVLIKMTYEYPYMNDEISKLGLKLLYGNCAESYCIESIKPITKLDDLKGKKIAILGSQAKWLAASGAVPVSMPIGDRAVGLQTGVVDGDSIPFDVGGPFRLYEFAKYHIQSRFGATLGGVVVMRQDKFNKMSPEDQRIFIDTGKEAFKHYIVEWEKWRSGAMTDLKKAGATVNPPFSDEDIAKWAGLVGEPVADWVKDGKAAGVPKVAEAVRKFIDLTKESGYKYPKEWKIE